MSGTVDPNRTSLPEDFLEERPRGYMPVSSKREWETPRDFFDLLWGLADGFDLDPCGQPGHYTVQRIVQNGGKFYDGSTDAMDGLSQPWHGKVYMNPPYGDELGLWVVKAVEEYHAERADVIYATLPVRTDTKWWQQYVMRGSLLAGSKALADVYFVPTLPGGLRYRTSRLSFGGAAASAPFPAALVVWGTL